jgi:hypothetical protein
MQVLHNCTVGNQPRLASIVASTTGRWLVASLLETLERAQAQGEGEQEMQSTPLEWHFFFLDSLFEGGLIPTLYDGHGALPLPFLSNQHGALALPSLANSFPGNHAMGHPLLAVWSYCGMVLVLKSASSGFGWGEGGVSTEFTS